MRGTHLIGSKVKIRRSNHSCFPRRLASGLKVFIFRSKGLRLQGSAAQDRGCGKRWLEYLMDNEGRCRGMLPPELRSDLDAIHVAQEMLEGVRVWDTYQDGGTPLRSNIFGTSIHDRTNDFVGSKLDETVIVLNCFDRRKHCLICWLSLLEKRFWWRLNLSCALFKASSHDKNKRSNDLGIHEATMDSLKTSGAHRIPLALNSVVLVEKHIASPCIKQAKMN